MNPLRARLEYLAVGALAFKFRWLPYRLACWLAAGVGWLAGDVLRLRRRVALDNLLAAFPELAPRELDKVYRRCWRHFSRVGAELARLPRLNNRFLKRWTEMSQQAVIAGALKRGRGVILVAGHFGNWELTGGTLAKLGYPVTYVVAAQANPLVDRWLDGVRRSTGVEIIRRRDAARGVLEALKRNRVVAMLSDQDAGPAGVFVPFFGRPASTPRGPALFHLKTGAPVVYGAAVRDGDGRYCVTLEELSFGNLSGDRLRDSGRIMAQVTARLESDVRLNPEQWFWLHRRWKTRPAPD